MPNPIRLTNAALIAIFAATATTASAQDARFADPAAIDRAVAGYTGAEVGIAGGARAPVDRRLRLVACAAPLSIAPYGRKQDSLQVSCPDAGGWRIFVPLSQSTQSAAVQVLIAKGDSVTIAIEGRGFSIAQTGRALESGAEGDWIRVAPPGKGETIRARVDRPGRVVIPVG